MNPIQIIHYYHETFYLITTINCPNLKRCGTNYCFYCAQRNLDFNMDMSSTNIIILWHIIYLFYFPKEFIRLPGVFQKINKMLHSLWVILVYLQDVPFLWECIIEFNLIIVLFVFLNRKNSINQDWKIFCTLRGCINY